MEKGKKWSLLLVGAVVVLTLGLIGSIVLAQDATPEATTPAQEEAAPETDDGLSSRGLGHWGGIGHGFGRHGNDETWLTYLAEALGITVDELNDAQDEAYAAWLADAVERGQLTQEQADQILAQRALKSYIDGNAILAEALGMTVDELEAALADQSLTDLMVERGIDSATLQANAQAAYEAAVQQAVADGVITQAQADEILAGSNFNLFGRGGFGGRHGGRGGRGGGWGFDLPTTPDSTTPDSTTPGTTDTSSDT
jgi:hypothetical protein